ncbi:MAG: T9SS type A sorting domain-containing protein [Bacteroidia bacterium]
MKKVLTLIVITMLCAIHTFGQHSNNLIKNAGRFTDGFADWTIEENGGDQAKYHPTEQVIITSYKWYTESQTINLLDYFSAEYLDKQNPIYYADIYGGYSGGGNANDNYKMEIILLDANDSIIHQEGTGNVTTNGVEHSVESNVITNYGTGLRKIVFRHSGKDAGFWAGHYGTVFYGTYITLGNVLVLGSSDLGKKVIPFLEDHWNFVPATIDKWNFNNVYIETAPELCLRTQLIDLVGKFKYTPEFLDSIPKIYMYERFTGNGTNKEDVFQAKIRLLDANKNVLLQFDTSITGKPDGSWTLFDKSFKDYPVGVRYIEFTDGGYAIETGATEGLVLDSAGVFLLDPKKVENAGISNLPNTSNVNLYPNPAHNQFTIYMDEPSLMVFNYEIHNTVGQVVEKGTGISGMPISISGIAQGVYSVKLSSLKNQTPIGSKKLIIE